MNYLIPLLIAFGVLYKCDGSPSSHLRAKRSAAGALHIVTNNEDPIRAEVQHENTADVTEKVVPSVESAYQLKSLRKSRGLAEHTEIATATTHISKLEIIRSVNRLVTLSVLIISAVAEFYPLVRYLYEMFYNLTK